jgi:hypothetical protein
MMRDISTAAARRQDGQALRGQDVKTQDANDTTDGVPKECPSSEIPRKRSRCDDSMRRLGDRGDGYFQQCALTAGNTSTLEPGSLIYATHPSGPGSRFGCAMRGGSSYMCLGSTRNSSSK